MWTRYRPHSVLKGACHPNRNKGDSVLKGACHPNRNKGDSVFKGACHPNRQKGDSVLKGACHPNRQKGDSWSRDKNGRTRHWHPRDVFSFSKRSSKTGSSVMWNLTTVQWWWWGWGTEASRLWSTGLVCVSQCCSRCQGPAWRGSSSREGPWAELQRSGTSTPSWSSLWPSGSVYRRAMHRRHSYNQCVCVCVCVGVCVCGCVGVGVWVCIRVNVRHANE